MPYDVLATMLPNPFRRCKGSGFAVGLRLPSALCTPEGRAQPGGGRALDAYYSLRPGLQPS